MAYTKYSLTPANNNATPPDGAPEGMLPSAVNDTMRDMMAQIRDCGDGIRDGTYTMTAPKITGGTITGAAFTGNTFTSPVISGGSINNTPIGGTTANSGAFTTLSASGVATISAGTVSAPALTTTGDTNTGIFFPAADTIAFTEGGVESMRIDSSGNVGIGTSSPTQLLDVNGNVAITGSSRRITGDFSSGAATRVLVQSSTTNGSTSFSLISNGTSTNSTFTAFAGSDAANSNGIQINANGSAARLVAINNGTSSAVPITFGQGNTEQMRIDTSGNVGIGTSSPASNRRLDATINQNNSAGIRTTNTSTGASASSNITCANATNNAEFGILGSGYGGYGVLSANGAYIYTNTGAIQLAADNNFIAFGTGTGVPERMRITADGNVGIGTNSPNVRLHVFKNAASDPAVIRVQNGASGNFLDYAACSVNAVGAMGYITAWGTGSARAGTFWLGSDNAIPIVFGNNDTERMRITSGGKLLVNTTNLNPSGAGSDGQVVINTLNGGQAALTCYNAGTGAVNIISLENGNGQVGRIQVNGTATSYLTSSDYRLKENIQPMTGALAKVTQLKPVTYTWKIDGSDGQGFIAHELQAIVPDCVGGEKDAVNAEGNPVYQGVDTSFLVATLTAAIQELKAELDATKAEIALLKSK